MITCPWCGTNYVEFQTNCTNCGGSLPLPQERPLEQPEERLAVPPMAPRDVPSNYVWRVISVDGLAITGGIFSLLGAVFGVVGVALTVAVITAFLGIPFAFIGISFLGGGLALVIWRYRQAQITADVLRDGQATLGQIETVHQNLQVRINGRHPWTVRYSFEAAGQVYRGSVTTLSQPDLRQQPGKQVYILYQLDNPQQNTIYPHPYGYYGV
jgi:membrane protein implicated in regulation of membrane protease activity